MYKRMLKHENEWNETRLRNKKKQQHNNDRRGGGRGRGGRGRGRRDNNQSAANFLLHAHSNDADGAESGGHQFLQDSSPGSLPSSWLLLDACSSIHLFSNPSLLCGIHATDRWMTIHGNGGTTRTNWIGHMKGIDDEIWFHPDAIANALSCALVKQQYDISIDGDDFLIHEPDGTSKRFAASGSNLYCVDTADSNSHTLATAVDDKKSNYTVKGCKRAELARKLQNTIAFPSMKDFLRHLDNNLIRNCHLQRPDAAAAEDIWGPNLGGLRGKTVRKTPAAVEHYISPLPPCIIKQHTSITLGMDIMCVNKVPFLTSISHNLRCGNIQALPNRQHDTILSHIDELQRIYAHRGFKIDTIRADDEFDELKTKLKGITLNTTSEDEHVPEIERHTRTIKERMRCFWNTIPHDHLPARLIIELALACVFWWNAFPPQDGVSDTMSPAQIVEGFILDYNMHCQHEFGSCAETHERSTNDMKARTTGAIVTRPTGNAQGGHWFYSLSTGRMLDRKASTTLNVPQNVIDTVHRHARRSKAPKGLVFGNRHAQPLDEDDAVANCDSDADSDYVS